VLCLFGTALLRTVGNTNLNLCAAVLLGLVVVGWCDKGKAQTRAANTAEANAAMIRNAYDAFSRGDIESVFAALDQNIRWHVPGRGPLSRDYRGHDEVRAFFEHFMSLSGGTFRIQVDDVLANKDRVVVLCTETAQRGGRTWSSPQVHLWTVRDGHALAFWEYEGDQQGEDEFWSMRN